MSKSKKAAKSVAIIITFTIASKLLGFVREALIAAKFGSGAETDTFFIALTAIALFTKMITSSINTTMIPVLSAVETIEGKKGKVDHTNNLINIISLISLIIIFIAWVLAPFILKILAYGFEGDQFKQAVSMMRIGLPSILLAGILGTYRGYLHSELMFTESAATNFPVNFIYITFLLFLSGIFGIKGLMVTSVLATVGQISLQIPGIRKAGYRYKYVLDFKDRYVIKILNLVPPVLISAVVSDFNAIIDKSMASTLVDGSISALNYANIIKGLTTSIFISAITTVIYPMFSQEANKENYDSFKKVIINGINIILLITVPATVGMIVLANPIVKVAFQRGAFDSTATYMTMGALVFYSIGLTAISVKSLLNRAFYSLQDTKTPMINGFISLGINLVLNLVLINSMAHRGLALATSISAIVTTLFLLYKLRKKIGHFGFLQSVKCGAKSLFASAVMGIIVYFLYKVLIGIMGGGGPMELIALMATVGVGALAYLLIIYSFRIKEVEWIIKVVKGKLKRCT